MVFELENHPDRPAKEGGKSDLELESLHQKNDRLLDEKGRSRVGVAGKAIAPVGRGDRELA
jgi:hypothetical protein